MTDKKPNKPQPVDPVVLPDVATQPTGAPDQAELPDAADPEVKPALPGTRPGAPDYLRELQREYDEQQEEGKL